MTEYMNSILPYVKKIMDISSRYKQSVKTYEKDKNVKVNLDEQAGIVAEII